MYSIIIDESGDVGLSNVQADPSPGPSQYFTLCAAIFNEDNRSQIERKLADVPFSKGTLHANKLGHFEKVHLCRVISGCPVGMLGVLSNKLSLNEYLPDAQKTPTHFYNKVMQYLLERVGFSLSKMRIKASDVRILVEAREQRYDSLLAFLRTIQQNPHHPNAIYLRAIDIFSISRISKKDDPCVALADMGAHAMFCAVRRDDKMFGLTESRYLNELRPVFIASKQGAIVPHSLKPIHTMQQLGLSPSERETIERLKNPNREYWKL